MREWLETWQWQDYEERYMILCLCVDLQRFDPVEYKK